MGDTYEQPEHGWTCFHCGETFKTVGSARDHFGAQQTATPGCMIKVGIGGERSLLMALRKAESALARYYDEDSDLHRFVCSLQSRHSEQLRIAEESGYERGLRDARYSEDVKAHEDTIKRLIEFAAESGIAYRDDHHDLIVEGFRALPDDLQAAINKREEEIEAELESE